MSYHWQRKRLTASGNLLGVGYLKRALQTLLCPISYTRIREIPVLLDLIETYVHIPEATVLDIASPQMLSGHLARMFRSWKIVYVNSFENDIADMNLVKAVLGLRNLTVRMLDARMRHGIEPCSLDVVVSCSVFEHVVDQDGRWGDTIVAQNVAAWLKPGGMAFISVPFYHSAFEETRCQPAYKDEYRKDEGCFFQRFYDPKTLHERIIDPSGLKIERLAYTGERFYRTGNIRKRMTMLCDSGKRSLVLGRTFSLLARLFLVQSDDPADLKKPYLAYVVLRKC